MFRKKKPEPAKSARRSAPAPFPMIGAGFDFNPEAGMEDVGDVSDGDLEDELMELLGGDDVGVKKAPKRAQVAVQKPVRRSAPPPPPAKQHAAGPGDGFASGDDDEGSDINEDEIGDLEDELHGVLNVHGSESSSSLSAAALPPVQKSTKPTPPGCISHDELRERLIAYMDAEKAAKASGDGAKARRCGRAIKTLNTMIADASKGKLVKEEDAPPMVSAKAVAAPRPPPAPAVEVEALEEEEMPSAQPEPVSAPPPLVPMRAPPQPPKRPSPPPPPAPAEEAPAIPTGLLVDFAPPPPVPAPRTSPPPPVAQRAAPPPPPPPEQPATPEAEIASLKLQALDAKKAGDKAKALELFRHAKELEAAVAAGAVGGAASGDGLGSGVGQEASHVPTGESDNTPSTTQQEPEEDGAAALPGIPPPPKTVLEALEQRLAKFQSVQAEAQAEGVSRKVRQYGRIVNQYKDAIRDHKKGRPIAADELPTPPGYPPIPVDPSKQPPVAPAAVATLPVPATVGGQLGPSPAASPKPALRVAPTPERGGAIGSPASARDASPAPGTAMLGAIANTAAAVAAGSPGGPTKVAQQLAVVKQKQLEYKTAALEAKKRGDIDKARELLKISKGFDPMIESLEGGMRVDVVNIPSLPGLGEDRNDFALLATEERILPLNEAAFSQLEEMLTKQLSISVEFKEYFKTIGDVVSASRFENRAAITQKDLAKLAKLKMIKNATQGPKIIQETRKYSVLRCNPDLGDDDVEVKVIKGVNYNFKDVKDADTYVKVEFPSSSENPQQDTSKVVKDCVAPEYGLTSRFQINRKSRATGRIFAKVLKVEVWKQGGWFRGDSLYGTASVKLKPLELQCNMHDTFDLMDGRKAVGGSVEVSIRVRNPILKKEVEEMTKRWTLVDWDKVA